MEGIQVSTEVRGTRNQVSVIKVGGYIDTTTSSEVERALNGLLKQGRYQIVIDLGNVDYISSAGWGIFISEIKAIRENNGDLKLVRMIPDVYEIFELLEFHHILDVYDSIEEAVQKFEESQFVEVVQEQQRPAPSSPQAGPPEPPPASMTSNSQPFSVESAANEPRMSRADSPGPMEESGSPEIDYQPNRAQRKPNILDLVNLPVDEKIKYVVAKYPQFGAYKISRVLNSPDFGFTKVGWFGVRSWLKRMSLQTRQTRRAFAERYRNTPQ